jgi:hypothetical protein
VHKCKFAICMYLAPQSHLPVFMALIIPNMRINVCYFVERCTHCTFWRQHCLYLLLLRAPTLINDKNGTRNQCQATTHQQSCFTQQLCTSNNTYRHRPQPSRDYTAYIGSHNEWENDRQQRPTSRGRDRQWSGAVPYTLALSVRMHRREGAR